VSAWIAVLVASVGCYGWKLAGLSVPARWVDKPAIRRFAELVPVALLAALVAVQTFAAGRSLHIDARAAGLGVAVVAVILRAPFVVVVVAAALTAALVRLAT
jgi:branched-subunit amino acid transport protein